MIDKGVGRRSALGLPSDVRDYIEHYYGDELGQMTIWLDDDNKSYVRAEAIDVLMSIEQENHGLYQRLDDLFGTCALRFVQDALNSLLRDRKKHRPTVLEFSAAVS